jgi:hypothetical protein
LELGDGKHRIRIAGRDGVELVIDELFAAPIGKLDDFAHDRPSGLRRSAALFVAFNEMPIAKLFALLVVLHFQLAVFALLPFIVAGWHRLARPQAGASIDGVPVSEVFALGCVAILHRGFFVRVAAQQIVGRARFAVSLGAGRLHRGRVVHRRPAGTGFAFVGGSSH